MILEKTGINIDDRNDYTNTPLHLAAIFGRNIETLKYLVELETHVNLEDKRGNGVVHYLVYQ